MAARRSRILEVAGIEYLRRLVAPWSHGVWQKLSNARTAFPEPILNKLTLWASANVVETLLRESSTDNTNRPHYYYCVRDNLQKERADPQFILASVVRQMCSLEYDGPILRPAAELCERRKGEASKRPTMEESVELIISMSASRPTTYIIIDALDECNPNLRGDLLEALRTIVEQSSGVVKIFVSSRDDQDIVNYFAKQPHVRIDARKTNEDLELFIETAVEKALRRKEILLGKADNDLIAQTKHALRTGAGGM